MEELLEKIDRYEKTLTTLRCSDVKEVRLMFGTLEHVIVNDKIFPIARLKHDYMKAIESRIIELKYEMMRQNERTLQLH